MNTPNIIEFTTDPKLLGLSLSEAQEMLLRAIYGLPLSKAQLGLWRLCTGREKYPEEPFSEVTVVARGTSLVERVYGHLGSVRHRSEVVEYRVENHRNTLGERLAALG